MKKISLLIILLLSMILLVSCNVDNIEISDKIEAPDNNTPPISGKWVIEDYKIGDVSVMDEETAKTYIGKEALFDKKLVAIGDDYCLEPSFKIKNVNTADYLIYQYKTNPKFLNIDKDEIQIVSVMNKEQFFYEFIKESEETIITNIDGVFFYLKLVSNKVEDEKIAEYFYTEKAMFRMADVQENDILRTGLLIGLKSLDLENREDNIEKWNYRTILIRSYNNQVVAVYEIEDIFLPRRTGFWKVGVNREEVDGKFNDTIFAYPQKKTLDIEQEQEKVEEKEEERKIKRNTLKNILYIGNDYISVENVDYLNKGIRMLEFYPIDNIDKGKPMKFSDITGEVGKEFFLEGANKEILLEEKYKNSSIDLSPNEESFGLFRRNGHWIFKGRINFIENGIYSYKNFNIKAIPPREIIHYDELSIPWNAIKAKIPEAVDAFTSPNEDMIIVITHNNLLIYLIDDGDIGDIPVIKIQLKSAEKVIMSEWAVGRYPLLWEEEFLKNEVKTIN
jgi:hypothetical protein